ncbi:MAG: isoamylase early set domain-containing protein [Deltaproteobacteria bacterium]|nr:isoamylase early set domain-containing protein [Deltaproteobacteria bacterium]
MSVNKKYFKSKPTCKVTFTIDNGAENSAKEAHVVGEFNEWSISANPMKPLKTGGFSTALELQKGREYQFRYLLDQKHWENEPKADRSVPTPFGDSHNSVIVV